MSHSVKRSLVIKVASLSVALMVSACSSDQRYKREVNGNLDYLDASGLKEIHAPKGMILPLQNGDYDINQVAAKGPLGTALDIRPPAQAMTVLSGSDAQVNGQIATLQLTHQPAIWSQIQQVVAQKKWSVASNNSSAQTLTTDWVKWQRADEDSQYQGRYQLSAQSSNVQQLVTVKLMELEQNGHKVHDPIALQRYTVQMLDYLSTELDKTSHRATKNNQNRQAIAVQSGSDESGLPNLIVRAPFTTTWQRLPSALKKLGFTVTDSDRSEGSIQLTYAEPDATTWKQLGVANPELGKGKYKLQVGDLNNRSSLQFQDSEGRMLTQGKNDALVSVLQSALK